MTYKKVISYTKTRELYSFGFFLCSTILGESNDENQTNLRVGGIGVSVKMTRMYLHLENL
jgi:hypothetical protein